MSEQVNEQDILDMDLSEADEHSTVERCLTFESGELILYISTRYIIEIINGHSITTLPLVPHYVKGIINLRGQVLPVVDLQLRMGKGETASTGKNCVIVLDIDSVSLGIMVDSVRQVVDIDLKNVRPIPLKRQQKLLDGRVNMEDGNVFMSVDCKALISTEDL